MLLRLDIMQKSSLSAYITTIVVFALVFSLVESLFYRAMPLSFRAEYTNVSPAQKKYALEERPSFNFTGVVKRVAKIDGRNSLDCYHDEGGRTVTYFNWYWKIKPNTESKPRPYLHPWPMVASTCKFKSDLYLEFNYWIIRPLAELETTVRFE